MQPLRTRNCRSQNLFSALVSTAALFFLFNPAESGSDDLTSPATDPLSAHWPLNEGSGTQVSDIAGSHHGGFEQALGGAPLTWDNRREIPELIFPGGPGSGYVKILKGGKILTGPFFKISIEIKPSRLAAGQTYLLNAKASSATLGGFLLAFGNGGKKLRFDLSDGNDRYTFATTLRTPLALGQWTAIEITYDGVELSMHVNDVEISRHPLPGFRIAPSLRNLHIGSYAQGQQTFSGSIRNVRLSAPRPSPDLQKLIVVSDLGEPAIDGNLNEATWEAAAFHSGFSDSSGKPTPSLTQTSFALSAGKDHLYIAVRNAIHGDFALEDESFEIDLDPDSSGNHVFRLGLNAANKRLDSAITHFGLVHDSELDMHWSSAVRRSPAGWVAEISIPYHELLVLPGQKGRAHTGHWLINVVRNPGASPSSWGVPRNGPDNAAGWNMTRGGPTFARLRTASGFPEPQYSHAVRMAVYEGRSLLGLDYRPSGKAPEMKNDADSLFVPNNLNVPNWFFSETKGVETLHLNTRYLLDLPPGISILAAGRKPGVGRSNGVEYFVSEPRIVERDGQPFTRVHLAPLAMKESWNTIGPIFFRSTLADGNESKLYFKSVWSGGEQPEESITLITKTFPTPGRPEELIEPLLWMHLIDSLAWPDFFNSYGKLGFNYLPVLNYDYIMSVEDVILPRVREARDLGFKIVWVDGATFYQPKMPEARSTDPVTGKPVNVPDICPAYRGPDYQRAIARTVAHVKELQADVLHLDIESLGRGAFMGKSGQCKRCSDYFHKTGKDPIDGLSDLGTQALVDIQSGLRTMAEEAGLPTPRLGAYHTYPGGFAYTDVFDCDKLLAAGIAFCQPTEYQVLPEQFGQKMRLYRKIAADGGRILPIVLPGGPSAHRNTGKLHREIHYDYLLEGYGSGVSGFLWFSFPIFKGIDFYYHGKAMEAINPIARQIYNGVPIEAVRSDRAEVSATALNGPEGTVVLLSDYTSESPGGPLRIDFPKGTLRSNQIWEMSTQEVGGSVHGDTLTLTHWKPGVPGANTALYYVGSLTASQP
jgi:hypothetical protein